MVTRVIFEPVALAGTIGATRQYLLGYRYTITNSQDEFLLYVNTFVFCDIWQIQQK